MTTTINGTKRGNSMETPSQILASKIVERLSKEHLVTPETAQKLSSPLATGKLKAEDWRLAVEKTYPDQATATLEGQG